MAYANHHNGQVKDQVLAGMIPSPLPLLLGQFKECEFGHVFEYAERRWPCDEIEPSLPHIIYVGHGEARLAKVMKTVAFVLVDEGQIDRWQIKSHRVY